MEHDKLVAVALMVLMVGVIGNAITTKNLCENNNLPFCKLDVGTDMAKPAGSLQSHVRSSVRLYPLHHPAAPPKSLFLSIWRTKKIPARMASTLEI